MKSIQFICLSLLFFSFTEKNSLKREFSEIEMNGKTLYIAKYEVSNGLYYKFLNDIKHDGKTLTKARVYSENWNNVLENPQPYIDTYFGEEDYFNYPVVNISHEGARLYCAWLSEKLSLQLNKNVIARLPTQEEWMFAAQAGQSEAIYGWDGTELEDKTGYLGNFKTNDSTDKSITAPITAYNANQLGLYNCSGNVAEMIQTKNISMGGSWATLEEDITLSQSAQDYSKANPQTGFRVILEID